MHIGTDWLGFGTNPGITQMVLWVMDEVLAAAGRTRDDLEIIMPPERWTLA